METLAFNFEAPERITFPLEGMPFAQMMEEIYKEQGHVRIVR